MRARWTLGLLGLVPLAIWLAPRLDARITPTAPPPPESQPAVSVWDDPILQEIEDPLAPLEVLGQFVWDGCTLRPAVSARDTGRPDLHVRTGYVPNQRLPDLLGELDAVGTTGVHFGFYTAPRSLEPLRTFEDLRYLTFEGDHLDDDALEPLSSLHDLWMLEMGVRPYESNEVTDAGLKHLSHLSHLEYLGIHAFEGVHGDGLRYLSPLESLRELELSYTHVGDAGLRHISHLPHLRTLSLQHTDVTNAGVAELRSLPQLKTLDLRQTAVTPEIADVLATFPSLERVVLHYNLQFDVIQAVRARGIQADGIGWIRGTVGCEHWPRL